MENSEAQAHVQRDYANVIFNCLVAYGDLPVPDVKRYALARKLGVFKIYYFHFRFIIHSENAFLIFPLSIHITYICMFKQILLNESSSTHLFINKLLVLKNDGLERC